MIFEQVFSPSNSTANDTSVDDGSVPPEVIDGSTTAKPGGFDLGKLLGISKVG